MKITPFSRTKSLNYLSPSFAALFVALILVGSCNKNQGIPPITTQADIIYLESNDYGYHQNSILAFLDEGNGQLQPLPGSPFSTGGSGIGNPTQILGPDDQDTPLILSQDNKYLFAVNPGSNTITVFNVSQEGFLQPISGSPFPSGGQTPQSLALHGHYLYVVNKAQDPLHTINQPPNYNVLEVAANGSLSQLQNSKFETTPGTSPAQVLLSQDKKFAFGTDFLGFMLPKPVGTLRSFVLSQNGLLNPVPGTPYTIPGMGGSLGLWENPEGSVLYVGFPMQAKVAVYAINPSSGVLTFNSAVDAGPAVCWLRTNKSGSHLYALNSAENTVSVFNTSNAISPISLQKFTLKKPGPLYPGPMGAMFTTSEPFGLGFSKSEKYLYVLNQHTNTDFSIGDYNYLHVLKLGYDGTMSEPNDPLPLPVSSKVRPQGIAVYSFLNQNANTGKQ